jgi:hypothetical protein
MGVDLLDPAGLAKENRTHNCPLCDRTSLGPNVTQAANMAVANVSASVGALVSSINSLNTAFLTQSSAFIGSPPNPRGDRVNRIISGHGPMLPSSAHHVKGPLWNAATQIFGVQPTLSVAHQAASNIVEGRPALEGATQAYTEGAIGSAAPMAGNAAVRGIGRLTGLAGEGDAAARAAAAKAATGEPPTAEGLEDIGRQHYGDIEGWGVQYTNPHELEALRNSITENLYRAGVDPRTEGRVFKAIDTLTESRRGPTGVPDWTDIDHARKMLNNAMADVDPPTRRGAALAVQDLDRWLADPAAQVRAGVDPSVAPDLAAKAALARSYWHASKAAGAWDQLIEKANNSSNNRDVTFRNEVRKIVNNPRAHWQYPPEAIDLMREGLHRGFPQAVSHFVKNFDPHSSFGLFSAFLSHSALGSEGMLLPLAAMGARYIGRRPLARVEQRVPGLIAGQATGVSAAKPGAAHGDELHALYRPGGAAARPAGPGPRRAHPQRGP